MSQKDPAVFLGHIRESIGLIEEYTEGMSKDTFMKESKIQDAIVRRIEIIGEAAKNLSTEFTEKHSDIPWKQIIGARDKIVHHYFGVDVEIVWNIITHDLPELKKKLEKM